jgi:solute carrier family 29 (equilibrative nucleoside transporter), member 1/2/3
VFFFVIDTGFQFFKNDFWQYMFMAVFALTNGYQGTLCMMFGPQDAAAANKERAGTIMVFFLTCGLTVGVLTGTVINDLTTYGTFLPKL